MINLQNAFQLHNLKNCIQKLITAFKNWINFDDNDDNSPNNVQYLAQRIDGKKVPINRKL